MERYANMGGNSGIFEYRIESESICVHFNKGGTYQYTYASAGKDKVEKMKELARKGQGLNAYINKVVKKLYSSKDC